MIVQAKVIDTFEIMLKCNKCGKVLRPASFDTESSQFLYKCECGYEEKSRLAFPYTKVTYDVNSVTEISEEEAAMGG